MLIKLVKSEIEDVLKQVIVQIFNSKHVIDRFEKKLFNIVKF